VRVLRHLGRGWVRYMADWAAAIRMAGLRVETPARQKPTISPTNGLPTCQGIVLLMEPFTTPASAWVSEAGFAGETTIPIIVQSERGQKITYMVAYHLAVSTPRVGVRYSDGATATAQSCSTSQLEPGAMAEGGSSTNNRTCAVWVPANLCRIKVIDTRRRS